MVEFFTDPQTTSSKRQKINASRNLWNQAVRTFPQLREFGFQPWDAATGHIRADAINAYNSLLKNQSPNVKAQLSYAYGAGGEGAPSSIGHQYSQSPGEVPRHVGESSDPSFQRGFMGPVAPRVPSTPVPQMPSSDLDNVGQVTGVDWGRFIAGLPSTEKMIMQDPEPQHYDPSERVSPHRTIPLEVSKGFDDPIHIPGVPQLLQLPGGRGIVDWAANVGLESFERFFNPPVAQAMALFDPDVRQRVGEVTPGYSEPTGKFRYAQKVLDIIFSPAESEEAYRQAEQHGETSPGQRLAAELGIDLGIGLATGGVGLLSRGARAPRYAVPTAAEQTLADTRKIMRQTEGIPPVGGGMPTLSEDVMETGSRAALKDAPKPGPDPHRAAIHGLTGTETELKGYVDNLLETSPNIKKTTTTTRTPPRKTTSETTGIEFPSDRLPTELAGAKPRYGMGQAGQFTPIFENHVDMALYIVAAGKKTKARRDKAYMDWLRPRLPGLTDEQIRAQGKNIRTHIGKTIKESGKPAGSDVLIPPYKALQGVQVSVGDDVITKGSTQWEKTLKTVEDHLEKLKAGGDDVLTGKKRENSLNYLIRQFKYKANDLEDADAGRKIKANRDSLDELIIKSVREGPPQRKAGLEESAKVKEAAKKKVDSFTYRWAERLHDQVYGIRQMVGAGLKGRHKKEFEGTSADVIGHITALNGISSAVFLENKILREKALRLAGNSEENLLTYLQATHAKEIFDQYPDRRFVGTWKGKNEAQAALDDLEIKLGTLDELKEAAAAIQSGYRKDLDALYREGFITREVYEQIQDIYPEYIKFRYKVQNPLDAGTNAAWDQNKSVLNAGQFSPHLDETVNRPLEFDNVLEHMDIDRMRNRKVVDENHLKRVIIYHALTNGVEGVKKVPAKVAAMKSVDDPSEKIFRSVKDPDGYVNFYDPARAGEIQSYQVPEWISREIEYLAQVSPPGPDNIFLKALGKFPASVLRGGVVTYNPGFLTLNHFADTLIGGWKAGLVPLSDLKAYKQAFKIVIEDPNMDDVTKAFVYGGFRQYRFYGPAEDYAIKRLEKAGAILDPKEVGRFQKFTERIAGVQDLPVVRQLSEGASWGIRAIPEMGETLELTTRIKAGKKKLNELMPGWEAKLENGTLTVDDLARSPEMKAAIDAAAEATLNFSRGGRIIKGFNPYVVFVNASLEGSKLPLRAMATEPGKFARRMGTIVAGQAMISAWNVQQEGYENIPAKDRYTALIFVLPEWYPGAKFTMNEHGQPVPSYIKIVFNTREAAPFMASATAAMEQIFSDSPDILNKFLDTLMGNALPFDPAGTSEGLTQGSILVGGATRLLPGASGPIVKQIANRTHFGAPIVSPETFHLDPSEQVSDRTLPIQEDIGDFPVVGDVLGLIGMDSPVRIKEFSSAIIGSDLSSAFWQTGNFVYQLFEQSDVSDENKNIAKELIDKTMTEQQEIISELPPDDQEAVETQMRRDASPRKVWEQQTGRIPFLIQLVAGLLGFDIFEKGEYGIYERNLKTAHDTFDLDSENMKVAESRMRSSIDAIDSDIKTQAEATLKQIYAVLANPPDKEWDTREIRIGWGLNQEFEDEGLKSKVTKIWGNDAIDTDDEMDQSFRTDVRVARTRFREFVSGSSTYQETKDLINKQVPKTRFSLSPEDSAEFFRIMSRGSVKPRGRELLDKFRSIRVENIEDQVRFRMNPEEKQEFFRLRSEFKDSLSPEDQALLNRELIADEHPLRKELIRDRDIIDMSGYYDIAETSAKEKGILEEWREYNLIRGPDAKNKYRYELSPEKAKKIRDVESEKPKRQEQFKKDNPYIFYLLIKWSSDFSVDSFGDIGESQLLKTPHWMRKADIE
jgi:hypothetical protein